MTPTSTAGNCSNSPRFRALRQRARNRQAGFTLIELAVVVLLIALFSAFSVPLLTGAGENRLDSAARRIAGTVKYLYNESALNGREYRLVFNLEDGTFGAQILELDGRLLDAPGKWALQKLHEGVRFRDVTIAGQGTVSAGEATAVIHPVGWMEETTIHLRQEERDLTGRIKPFTGTSEIYEGYREF